MKPPRQRLKSDLAARRPVIGISPVYPAPALAEFLAVQGFDLIFIDCERTGADIERIADIVRAAHCGGAGAVLRPWSKDPGLLRRYLNCGIDGFVLPEIESAAEIRMALDVIRHTNPPDAETILMLALIESALGVEKADEILAVPGLDAIQIGTSDLAVSLGLPRRGNHPDVKAITFDLLARARAAQKSAGAPVNAFGLSDVVEAGGNCIMYFLEDLLRDAARTTFASFPPALRRPAIS